MHGTHFQRSVRAISHAIRCPGDALRWPTYARKTPIGLRLPWISWPAIRFLRNSLRKRDVVLEWGAGGSTLFFLDIGCYVTTIESSAEWLEKVRSSIRSDGMSRWKPVLVMERDQYLFASDLVERPDLILVDGLHELRIECVRRLIARELPGLLVLDDSWRNEYAVIPELLSACKRTQMPGFGPGRIGVTQTDIYMRLRRIAPAE